MSTAPQTAAGWFADPWAPEIAWRWWDGMQWTHHVAPMQPGGHAFERQRHLHPVAGTAQTAADARPRHADERFAVDRFIVRQRFRLFLNHYDVHAPADDGLQPADGPRLAGVRHKLFRLKEQIRFVDGDEREFMGLTARQMMDARGTSDVTDAAGNRVGMLQKEFMRSLVTSTWKVHDAAGRHIATAEESSLGLALWRRFGEMLPLPVVGELLSLIPMPYAFTILAGADAPMGCGTPPGSVIGTYRRRIGLRDIYDMDLRGDTALLIDRRLAIALAVALDGLQSR